MALILAGLFSGTLTHSPRKTNIAIWSSSKSTISDLKLKKYSGQFHINWCKVGMSRCTNEVIRNWQILLSMHAKSSMMPLQILLSQSIWPKMFVDLTKLQRKCKVMESKWHITTRSPFHRQSLWSSNEFWQSLWSGNEFWYKLYIYYTILDRAMLQYCSGEVLIDEHVQADVAWTQYDLL